MSGLYLTAWVVISRYPKNVVQSILKGQPKLCSLEKQIFCFISVLTMGGGGVVIAQPPPWVWPLVGRFLGLECVPITREIYIHCMQQCFSLLLLMWFCYINSASHYSYFFILLLLMLFWYICCSQTWPHCVTSVYQEVSWLFLALSLLGSLRMVLKYRVTYWYSTLICVRIMASLSLMWLRILVQL